MFWKASLCDNTNEIDPLIYGSHSIHYFHIVVIIVSRAVGHLDKNQTLTTVKLHRITTTFLSLLNSMKLFYNFMAGMENCRGR